MNRCSIEKELISLSQRLGCPEKEMAIIGEGNTSALLGDGTYLLKASGFELSSIDERGFVLMYLDKILKLLEKESISENELKLYFQEAKVVPSDKRRPSVEALLHAVCLSYEGITFVGHTHPVYINSLTCATSFPENLQGRMYPDEIVLLGIDSVYVPYTDPGIPLAKELKQKIDTFIIEHKSIPKSIYLQNHGFVAIGGSAKEVEHITLTAEKAARVRLGACLAGGIHALDRKTVTHIWGRPDEKYRQQIFTQVASEENND
ncbi:class II aldolase/adducin family protein [Treponema sp. OMZ 840]|uniref:class II aldolase/adducin family protein n=1 Tax=Treponema sp. OMZ 840 TaxID=244313 RepID=UPI003D94AB6C